MSEKCIIFILGVGRSGTSALTRVLSLCGCVLPNALLGANDANPRGFWEPCDAVKINDEFLFRHGSTPFDPTMRLQEELCLDVTEREDFVGRIREFLAGCPSGPLLVIKDPRITPLFEFWLEAARRNAFAVKVVVPVRAPSEVAASAAVLGVSAELSNTIWLKCNLLAERHSRDLPRVTVRYENLLANWRAEVSRISQRLDIPLRLDRASDIDQFLSPDLHRQRDSTPPADVFRVTWISRVYAVLSGAAEDVPIEQSSMDEIYEAYRACERVFRVSLDDFRGKFSPEILYGHGKGD